MRGKACLLSDGCVHVYTSEAAVHALIRAENDAPRMLQQLVCTRPSSLVSAVSECPLSVQNINGALFNVSGAFGAF